MAAFDFPSDAPDGYLQTNPNTGVTYQYNSATGTWLVVGTTASDIFVTDVELAVETNARVAADNALSSRIGAVENDYTTTDEYNSLLNGVRGAQSTADSALSKAEANETAIENLPTPATYQIQTDKILRSSDPAIELVDSEGYYSNVKFQGTGGITITSDMQSIIIDGSGIEGGGEVEVDVQLGLVHDNENVGIKVNGSLSKGVEIPSANRYAAGVLTSADWNKLTALGTADEYYTKDEIDDQFRYRGLGYRYEFDSPYGTIQIRDGKFNTDSSYITEITFISIGPLDYDGKTAREAVINDKIEIVDPNTGATFQYKVTGGSNGSYSVEYEESNTLVLDEVNTPLSEIKYTFYIYPTHISSADYYNKTQSNERFLNKKAGTQNTLASDVKYRGAQTAPEHIATVEFVNNAIASVQSSEPEVDQDDQIKQNEDQLQALSTSLFNLINKVDDLNDLDLDSALSALAQAQQDIIELKSKVNTLEHTQFLILE